MCLYLDEERTNSRANALCSNCGVNVNCSVPLRDDGDGSSSSTNADEPMTNMNRYTNGLSVRIFNNLKISHQLLNVFLGIEHKAVSRGSNPSICPFLGK